MLIKAARMARRKLFTPLHCVSELPQKVVSMRVLLRGAERSETLQREVCKIVDGHDRLQKKLKEAEAKLEAAEKRIAEHDSKCDEQYLLGMCAGWNFGTLEDADGFNAAYASRSKLIQRHGSSR
jgi:hypothetical protein